MLEKSWKILFTLIIPRALNFSASSRDLLLGRSAGFSVVRGLFKFFFVLDVEPMPTSTSFVLLQKRKREPRVLSGRTRTWVFFCLSCRATRRRSGTSIEWSWKDADDEGHGGNRRAHESKGLRRDSSQLLRFRRHFSPWLFETSGLCHSIMPSLFILFIQCWKFNSFYSKVNEWPRCASLEIFSKGPMITTHII